MSISGLSKIVILFTNQAAISTITFLLHNKIIKHIVYNVLPVVTIVAVCSHLLLSPKGAIDNTQTDGCTDCGDKSWNNCKKSFLVKADVKCQCKSTILL